MYIKISTVAVTVLQIAGFVQAATTDKTAFVIGDYWKSFNSKVDPNNIVLGDIPQVTSDNPATQCKYYTPPSNFNYNTKEWPNLWETATSNGMTKTAEFKKVYNAIDWTKAPKIAVRKSDANGALIMTGYDQSNDPDCWWSASTCTKPKLEGVYEDIYTCPEPETWGLTYDDGPNCSHNAFYDYLEEQKLKASMFYIGSNVVNWPYGAQRGQKNGHHIADHTWSHQLMTTLTNTEVLAELYYTQKAIKMVTGVTPKHWRPAFGDVDDRVRWIATQLDLTTILWDLDTDDWAAETSAAEATVKKTYDDFVAMGANGTFKNSGQITLTHEINNTTMSLAIEFLPKIRAAYKNVIDVATCMNITHPYQEDSVTFAPFGADDNAKTSAVASSAAPSASAKVSDKASSSAVDSNAASSVTQLANNNAAEGAGVQLSPNYAVLAVFAFAAYVL
ncbi:chitin deacetylase 1 [Helicostylum pulchrum]|uniref:NodB homology domain-containing protein n=1 Tax=Helicostylum pulchrum TaxID=562976 RepID=A0ABP9Y273_9FUNG|nr:chitin deacetylase 1 [Helicostylum pulchrum]